MSIEEKTDAIIQKLGQIADVAMTTQQIVARVMVEKITLGSQEISYTLQDKQKLLEWWATQKTRLQQLVNELP